MQFVLLAALFFSLLGSSAALMAGIAVKLVVLAAVAGVELAAALWLVGKVRSLRKRDAQPEPEPAETGNDPRSGAFPG